MTRTPRNELNSTLAPIQDPFRQLAASTAGSVGNEFLCTLVTTLREIMTVNLCFVTLGVGEPPVRARAIYSWRDGKVGSPIEYDLEGTPCQLVYNGQIIVVPEQLAQKFPKEKPIRQSYCGVPLRNNAGKVHGHFAVFSNTPIQETDRIEGIVRIFGVRVQAELQRIAHDEERDELIARLRRQRAVAHQANKFMSQVLGMVAHDLRNPLASIISRAEFIQMLVNHSSTGSSDSENSTSLVKLETSADTIINAADRMNRMISDLLETAKKEANEITLHPARILLTSPVSTATRLHQDNAEAKSISLYEDYEEGIYIQGDEDRLADAIGNLISNAIKFSSPGANVHISTHRLPDEKLAEVIVADEGLGMTEDDIAGAFMPFRSLSARPTTGETSTGLGLAIVKTIAEAHGGLVAIKSSGRGHGTAMSILLPRTP